MVGWRRLGFSIFRDFHIFVVVVFSMVNLEWSNIGIQEKYVHCTKAL